MKLRGMLMLPGITPVSCSSLGSRTSITSAVGSFVKSLNCSYLMLTTVDIIGEGIKAISEINY